MTTKATSSIKIKQWDEKPVHDVAGEAKITRAAVGKSYEGDLQGEGALEYLMVGGLDGVASFVGVERITGRLGARTGSFVVQITGTYVGGVPNESLTIVHQTGSGELTGLRGRGTFAAGPNETYLMNLEYEFVSNT